MGFPFGQQGPLLRAISRRLYSVSSPVDPRPDEIYPGGEGFIRRPCKFAGRRGGACPLPFLDSRKDSLVEASGGHKGLPYGSVAIMFRRGEVSSPGSARKVIPPPALPAPQKSLPSLRLSISTLRKSFPTLRLSFPSDRKFIPTLRLSFPSDGKFISRLRQFISSNRRFISRHLRTCPSVERLCRSVEMDFSLVGICFLGVGICFAPVEIRSWAVEI